VAAAATKAQMEAQQQVIQQQSETKQGSGQSDSVKGSDTKKSAPDEKPDVNSNTFYKSSSASDQPDNQTRSNFQTKRINIQA
jgi:hypothetical protein